MSDTTKQRMSVYAIVIGWIVTLIAFIYNVATVNANYSFRLDSIERELISLDARLDTSEAFRVELSTDLAEIKTDLLWIRKTLEGLGNNTQK